MKQLEFLEALIDKYYKEGESLYYPANHVGYLQDLGCGCCSGSLSEYSFETYEQAEYYIEKLKEAVLEGYNRFLDDCKKHFERLKNLKDEQ